MPAIKSEKQRYARGLKRRKEVRTVKPHVTRRREIQPKEYVRRVFAAQCETSGRGGALESVTRRLMSVVLPHLGGQRCGSGLASRF